MHLPLPLCHTWCASGILTALAVAALHHAADMGHVEVVADLIIGGANVQRVDNRGYPPAHLAAAAGHVDVMEKLLGAGRTPPLALSYRLTDHQHLT